MNRSFRLACIVVPMCAARLAAQGNLSTQGFGYPQGQLTSRALAMGGGIGEIDASSALNPAAIGRVTNRTVLFQIEPEFRTLTSTSSSDRTTTARYPLITIAVPFGTRLVTGVSASSLLDRSWSTTTKRMQTLGTEQVETNLREASNGAINDLRLAETWTNRSWLAIGVGVHAITGRNVVTLSEEFTDSSFSLFANAGIISYSGSAVSGGVQMSSQTTHTTVGLSYRKGFSLRAKLNDTTLAEGDVPDRFGVSAAFTGIQGTILSARVAHDGWSSMTPMLAVAGEQAHDSWDIGGGGEFTGPRLLGQALVVRAGARSRTLPFEAQKKAVHEKSLAFGTGLTFGGGRMSTDVTGVRQWRDAGLPSVKERAWTLSISLTARP